jgi:hypothetical protein
MPISSPGAIKKNKISSIVSSIQDIFQEGVVVSNEQWSRQTDRQAAEMGVATPEPTPRFHLC